MEEHTADSVSLRYRLMAQTGYPWTLDLQVALRPVRRRAHGHPDRDEPGADRRAVRQRGPPLPRGGPGPVDAWELTLPADTRLLADRSGCSPWAGRPWTARLRLPGRPADARHRFDDAFTDLSRDDDGGATTVLRDPATGRAVALWVDEPHRWLMVYTADDVPATAPRRSLAVEPMTAPADAFRRGEDLVTSSAPATASPPPGASARLSAHGDRRVDQRTGRPSSSGLGQAERATRALELADRDAGPVAVGALDAHRRDRGAVGEVEGDPGGARRQVDRDDLGPLELAAPVAVDDHEPVRARRPRGSAPGRNQAAERQQPEEEQRAPLEERELAARLGVEGEPGGHADDERARPPKATPATRAPSGRQVCGRVRSPGTQRRQAWMSVSRIPRAPSS